MLQLHQEYSWRLWGERMSLEIHRMETCLDSYFEFVILGWDRKWLSKAPDIYQAKAPWGERTSPNGKLALMEQPGHARSTPCRITARRSTASTAMPTVQTYHAGTGTLQLYTHHVTAPTAPGGRPEYHMMKLRGFNMRDSRLQHGERANKNSATGADCLTGESRFAI